MNPSLIHEYWLGKYGIWCNKSEAQKILGRLPFDSLEIKYVNRPGYGRAMFKTIEVVQKGMEWKEDSKPYPIIENHVVELDPYSLVNK